jgi:hypothetical protein
VSVKTRKTDAELAALDIVAALRAGLAGPERTALFGEGAVAAAILLDRAGVQPRSVSFLAEVVRSGGTRYAENLPEPLPTPDQTSVIRPWLVAAAESVSDMDGDEQVARWLAAVAAILAMRQAARG